MDGYTVTMIGGFVFGGMMLAAVAYVFVTTKEMGVGGIMLAVIGFALVGITMWTDAEFQVGDMSAKLSRAEKEVETVSSELRTVSTELESKNVAVRDLTQRLELSNTQLIELKADPRLKLDPRLIERYQDISPAIDPQIIERARTPGPRLNSNQLRNGSSGNNLSRRRNALSMRTTSGWFYPASRC